MDQKAKGKGFTKNISGEEHDATRRARKAAQKAAAKARVSNRTNRRNTSIVVEETPAAIEQPADEIREELPQEAININDVAEERQQKEFDRTARQAAARDFRTRQANLALEHPAMLKLSNDPVALRFARGVLAAFPSADPKFRDSLPRTELAARKALETLGHERMDPEARGQAITRGKSAARKALVWAYERLIELNCKSQLEAASN